MSTPWRTATRWPGRSTRIATRLPQMLERAGVPEIARQVDSRLIDQALPRIKEKAYRARYQPVSEGDEQSITRKAG